MQHVNPRKTLASGLILAVSTPGSRCKITIPIPLSSVILRIPSLINPLVSIPIVPPRQLKSPRLCRSVS